MTPEENKIAFWIKFCNVAEIACASILIAFVTFIFFVLAFG